MKINELFDVGKNIPQSDMSVGDFITFEGISKCLEGTIVEISGDTLIIEGAFYTLTENTKKEYDQSSGGPYDRGSADSYYGRNYNPHKIVDDPDSGVKGSRKKVPLTDPDEIEAYDAGYRENDDKKDYGFDESSNITEAEYHGRKVKLGKPMKGDVKKYKVYVMDPKTKNVKKVNFGDKNMEIKRDDPKRRSNFRARHNCKNPGPRTKARYWACRMWSGKSVSKILKGK